jgi:hypothetical protein
MPLIAKCCVNLVTEENQENKEKMIPISLKNYTPFFKMKISFPLIIVICLLFSCTTQPATVKNWFSEEMESSYNIYGTNDFPVVKYVRNFTSDDVNTMRDKYVALLVFIEEAVAAYHENIGRAYAVNSLTLKRPVLKKGKLLIVEETGTTSWKWNNTKMERVESVDIYVLEEFFFIHVYSCMYNVLLDHWLSLTGELLGERIDVGAVQEKLFDDHAAAFNLRKEQK